MTGPRRIAVVDIGKTNAKLALVDLATCTEVAVVTRPNTVLPGPPYPHFDTEGHWAFLLDALRDMHRDHGIDAISVTTHGAAGALLDGQGGLAAPILDYEHTYPDDTVAAYDALRPGFATTGAPRLSGGLNLGAQIHYQITRDPGLRDRIASVVTYPQYWGHRLTGQVACDVTSIGCHTDLWAPRDGRLSDLPATLGLAGRIAPVRKSTDILGPVLPEIAARTGLLPGTPVAVGIHDSNASLYPYIRSHPAPFSVVSTGTWVIVMSVGGAQTALDPDRDILLNVDATGAPVPSSRFMGGREYEIVRDGTDTPVTDTDLTSALDGPMLLPSVAPGTGPFPDHTARWTRTEPAPGTPARAAALSLYLALMTDTCLRLTGAAGDVIVEGPFARNIPYLRALAALTGRPVYAAASATGTSIGAALLFAADPAPPALAPAAEPLPGMDTYAARWHAAL